MDQITFICPRCMMADREKATLNSIEDIAYSMPDSMFQKLHGALEMDHPELAKEVSEKQDRIRCITWQDIEDCMPVCEKRGNTLRGTFVLTSEWLVLNYDRFGLNTENLKNLESGMVLYQEELRFYYSEINGYRFPTKIRNADEAMLSDERCCAKCGRLLSPDTGKAPELRILLQGSSRAGKTSCIIALISRLLDCDPWAESGFRVKLTTGGYGRATDMTHYHNWIKQEVDYYRDSIKVEKTKVKQDEPAVYSLLVKIDDRETVLTFVDMPGEYFDNVQDQIGGQTGNQGDSLLKQYMPIYKQSDVIWTCLPYETVVSEHMTDEQWELLTSHTGLTRDLGEYTDQRRYFMRLGELIDEFDDLGWKRPPHAVILTKTDDITATHTVRIEEQDELQRAHIIPCDLEEMTLLRKEDNRTVFQERACHALCSGVSAYVRRKNQRLDGHFKRFSQQTRYFAIAAYGHPAQERPSGVETGTAEHNPPAPFQVEMPFLWSLAISGYLPIGYRRICWKKRGLAKSILSGGKKERVADEEVMVASIAEADDCTKNNLLQDQMVYEEHEIIL